MTQRSKRPSALMFFFTHARGARPNGEPRVSPESPKLAAIDLDTPGESITSGLSTQAQLLADGAKLEIFEEAKVDNGPILFRNTAKRSAHERCGFAVCRDSTRRGLLNGSGEVLSFAPGPCRSRRWLVELSASTTLGGARTLGEVADPITRDTQQPASKRRVATPFEAAAISPCHEERLLPDVLGLELAAQAGTEHPVDRNKHRRRVDRLDQTIPARLSGVAQRVVRVAIRTVRHG